VSRYCCVTLIIISVTHWRCALLHYYPATERGGCAWVGMGDGRSSFTSLRRY
jgi:hypothetical protein